LKLERSISALSNPTSKYSKSAPNAQNLWEEIAEHLELYDLELPPPEDLFNSDSDDENLASLSFSMHQSSSNVPHTMEEILNTSNHIIVDLPGYLPRKRKVPS
jgi:hypothetical protein